MKISVSTDISVLEFYRYIGYIRDISVDIFTLISIYRKLNCCYQFITVGSSQDFKSGYLNISSIYLDISSIFYRKIKLTRACVIDLIFPRYIGPKSIYRRYIGHRRYRVEHHRYRIYRRYIDGYIGYFHIWS